MNPHESTEIIHSTKRRDSSGGNRIHLKNRTICVGFCVLLLATLSVSVASGQVSTDQQPSPENNMMYLWGDASLASGSCFTDFSSDGATEVGFGEYDDTENIDFSCSLSGPLSQELFLDSEGNVIKGKSTQTHFAAGVPGSVDGLSACTALEILGLGVNFKFEGTTLCLTPRVPNPYPSQSSIPPKRH